jgi:hypothetical protein
MQPCHQSDHQHPRRRRVFSKLLVDCFTSRYYNLRSFRAFSFSTRPSIVKQSKAKQTILKKRTYKMPKAAVKNQKVNEALTEKMVYALLIIFIVSFFTTIILAPPENISLVTSFMSVVVKGFYESVVVKGFYESVVVKGLFEIALIRGLGGAANAIKSSIEKAVIVLYNDFAVEKLVIFVAVAAVVRQIPWIADTVVKLATKLPK